MRARHMCASLLALFITAGCSDAGTSNDGAARRATRASVRRQGAAGDPSVAAGRPQKTRLAVVGDFGTGDETELKVARSIKRWVKSVRVKGFITTGDNVYPSGHPDSFDAAWHEPYGWVDRRDLKKAASLGNHDHATDEGRPVMDLLDMPARRYRRHFRYVDVLVLDSNRIASDSQKRWLKNRLKESRARWQIVAFHHPLYNCGEHHDQAAAVRRAWIGPLRRFGADLVLNGHDHNYQRFKKRRGVVPVVTGGGGADLYDLGPCPGFYPNQKANDDEHHHHVRLFITRSAIEIRAVTPAGKTLDRHFLTR